MGNCKNCGGSYNPGEAFCGICGASLQDVQTGVRQASNYSSSNNFVKLSENEVEIKTYHCTTLKKPNGEGYLTVTNKRVVFHGYGSSSTGKSKLVSEVPIETISGVRTYFGTGINIFALISAIIFGILSTYMAFSENFGVFSKYSSKVSLIPFLIFLALTVLFAKKCMQGSYDLSIFSSGAASSPISIGDGSFGSRLTGQGALMTLVATPAEDTIILMQEIGAIIMDFKVMGDHAIQKWAPNIAEKRSNDSQQNQNTKSNNSDEEFFK